MKFNVFEKMVRDSGMKPLKKVNLGGVSLMTAEGYKAGDRGAYWEMAYAVGMDEFVDTCQRIKIPTHVRMPSGIEVRVSEDERLAVVMRAAKRWIASNEEVKRYEKSRLQKVS